MDKRFFTAQYGQDEVLDKLCYPKGNESHVGTFIEIGAFDGVDISNTYMLEKRRGWAGVLVEPIPEKFNQAKHNRWNPVWNGCIWNKDGVVDFLRIKGYSEMLSGIESGFSSKHSNRIMNEVRDHKQELVKLQLPCRTINSLMSDFGLSRVDFMSLDAQTAEFPILEAYDPEKYPCKAILLDYNGCNEAMLNLWFNIHGYELYWKHQSSDERLFLRSDLKWSWE